MGRGTQAWVPGAADYILVIDLSGFVITVYCKFIFLCTSVYPYVLYFPITQI